MNRYDAIIVGGGHNGLVAGGYLAGAGLNVLVLEKRDRLGGPAGNYEFLPGYTTSVTNSPGSLEPKIVRDMELQRHGLTFTKTNATLVHPLRSGQVFVSWRDKHKTDAQFNSYSKGESERYAGFFRYLDDFAKRLDVSLFQPPPGLQELVRNLGTLEDQEAFSRVFFGSARGLFDEFELSPETQAILGPLSVVSGQATPSTPGTPLNMMMRPLSLHSETAAGLDDPRKQPLRGSTGLPEGGMGAVIDALETMLMSRGATIRKGVGVDQILENNGRVVGVVTDDGESIEAPIVVAALNPRTTIVDLLRESSEWEGTRKKISKRSMLGKGFKLVLALDGVPEWAAANGDPAIAREMAAVQFRIAPSLDYLEKAHGDMMLGRLPQNPVIWGLTPSVVSPSLSPEGKHLMSLNIGNAPYALAAGIWEDERDRFVKRIVDTLSEWIPNLPSLISDHTSLDPYDIEEEYGLVESNITHGDALPWNQFWMRPLPGLHKYRTPTRGLYLSGVGTWPGNFVSGIPGHNASQAVLGDLREEHLNLSLAVSVNK